MSSGKLANLGSLLWPCRERCVNIRLGACAAPATVECVTVYRAMYKGLPRVSRGQLATIVERTVNQNCCFPEQVRCQIIEGSDYTLSRFLGLKSVEAPVGGWGGGGGGGMGGH